MINLKKNFLAIVKLLLDKGSDINAQIEQNHHSALSLACYNNKVEVVSLLLDRKANKEHYIKVCNTYFLFMFL